MSSTASDDWAAYFRRALRRLSQQKGEHFAEQLTPILFTNLRHKRPQNYLKRHPDKAPDDYVTHVTALYEELSGYLYQLQQEKSDSVWLPLCQKLTLWAQYELSRIPNGYLLGQPEDMAQEAVSALMTARFPYDTPFDPWARVILRNTRVAVQKRSQSSKISWISWEGHSETTAAAALVTVEDAVTTHQDLLQAIEMMTHEGRQRLILLRYFDGLSYAEMSQFMEKSASALYKLHCEAIEELKDILR
ncbi:MAG: hypothetical protein Fur0021_29470 [Candidatus Promineifilaceae bacterium]